MTTHHSLVTRHVGRVDGGPGVLYRASCDCDWSEVGFRLEADALAATSAHEVADLDPYTARCSCSHLLKDHDPDKGNGCQHVEYVPLLRTWRSDCDCAGFEFMGLLPEESGAA